MREEASPCALTSCASRATGHPNSARVQVRHMTGPAQQRPRFAGAWTPRTARPASLGTRDSFPRAPLRSASGSPSPRRRPLSSAPGHPGPERGQSPAAPPATRVRPRAGPSGRRLSEGSPATRAGPCTPDPAPRTPIPDLERTRSPR